MVEEEAAADTPHVRLGSATIGRQVAAPPGTAPNRQGIPASNGGVYGVAGDGVSLASPPPTANTCTYGATSPDGDKAKTNFYFTGATGKTNTEKTNTDEIQTSSTRRGVNRAAEGATAMGPPVLGILERLAAPAGTHAPYRGDQRRIGEMESVPREFCTTGGLDAGLILGGGLRSTHAPRARTPTRGPAAYESANGEREGRGATTCTTAHATSTLQTDLANSTQANGVRERAPKLRLADRACLRAGAASQRRGATRCDQREEAPIPCLAPPTCPQSTDDHSPGRESSSPHRSVHSLSMRELTTCADALVIPTSTPAERTEIPLRRVEVTSSKDGEQRRDPSGSEEREPAPPGAEHPQRRAPSPSGSRRTTGEDPRRVFQTPISGDVNELLGGRSIVTRRRIEPDSTSQPNTRW